MATSLIVKLALLNIRSLIKKYFLINDLISTYKLDFLLLTETWLDSIHFNTTLIESSPPTTSLLVSTVKIDEGEE